MAGWPEPECDVELGEEWVFIARVDLYLREWGIAVEREGDQSRTDAATYARDLRWYELLAAAGVLAVRVAKEHVRRPEEVVGRIQQALVSRGYQGPALDSGAQWRDAFEKDRRIQW